MTHSKSPLLDDLAFGEVNLLQIAADAGADFDEFDRLEPARVFVPLDDAFGDRRGDDDFDRRRARGGGNGFAAASGEQEQH